MTEHKVPVQSLIDHIKTAVDVDPWAKEMAEELLKAQEPVEPMKRIEENEWTVCGCCKSHIISKWSFCPYCGKAVKWDEPPKEE